MMCRIILRVIGFFLCRIWLEFANFWRDTMQKQKNPFSLMAFIRPHRAGFIASTVLAVLSVASGMVPYFAVAKMVNLLISG